MNRSGTSLLAMLLVLVIGCNYDKTFPDNHVEINAKKNGEEWKAVGLSYNASSHGSSIDTISFRGSTFTEQGYLRNQLNFLAIPLCIGELDMKSLDLDSLNTVSSVSLYLLYDDGHVAGDRYDIIEGHPSNHFEFTKIDLETGTIKGNFELAMIVDTSLWAKKDPAMPDTFFFTDGRFTIYNKDFIRD